MFPSPPPEAETWRTDPRIAACAATFPGVELQIPAFKAMHPMGAELSQECVTMMGEAMCTPLFHNQFRVPRYEDWVDDEADWSHVYTFHRRQLQHLQWRNRRERWVLKTGAHLWGLAQLLVTYPDARIVFTHRDPVKSMTSYASLTSLVRSMGSDEVDRVEVARDWTERLRKVLNRGIAVRQARPYPQAVFYDMYFTDFIGDQFATVERIYDALDLPMTDVAADAMRAFIADHPPGKDGIHRYAPEEFRGGAGPDPGGVRRLHRALRARAGTAELTAGPPHHQAGSGDGGCPPPCRAAQGHRCLGRRARTPLQWRLVQRVMRQSRRVFLAASAVVAGWGAGAGAAGASVTAPGGAGADAPFVHGLLSSPQGGFIYDQYGRVVILHGVNAVYKRPPYELYVDPGKPWDFTPPRMRRPWPVWASTSSAGHHLGRASSREPSVPTTPPSARRHPERSGQWNQAVADAYLARVARRSTSWPATTSTRCWTCTRTSTAGVRGEGAPAWAVCTNGLPHQSLPGRWSNTYSSPALDAAVQNFWTNDVVGDLQGEYDRSWAAVAASSPTTPGSSGYDPINEPFTRTLGG